jgi:ribonuclease P protein component
MAEAGRPRARLPRAERLRAPAEFRRLFQRSARLERPAFVLLWIREPGPRAVAFAAGRRLGGSVQRNRARRRLREAYRRRRSLLPPEGIRLCLLARGEALGAPFAELVAQVETALRHVARVQRRATE